MDYGQFLVAMGGLAVLVSAGVNIGKVFGIMQEKLFRFITKYVLYRRAQIGKDTLCIMRVEKVVRFN